MISISCWRELKASQLGQIINRHERCYGICEGDIYRKWYGWKRQLSIGGWSNFKYRTVSARLPPDPSRIPSVVRTVGELDLEGEISALGASKQTDPDISALEEFLSEVEPPEPLANVLSVDPMAEAWLQLVLTMVVREHGHTSLSISDINRLLGDRVTRARSSSRHFSMACGNLENWKEYTEALKITTLLTQVLNPIEVF